LKAAEGINPMVLKWIEAAVMISFAGLLAFIWGRAPAPKVLLQPATPPRTMSAKQSLIFFFWIIVLVMPGVFANNGLHHKPLGIRITALCGSYFAMGVGWFLGTRARVRSGQAPFAIPLPEGRAPRWDERVGHWMTPARMVLVFAVLLFGSLILNETAMCNSDSSPCCPDAAESTR